MSQRRTSLLVQASDVLSSFRFSRRRTSLRQPPPPVQFSIPHVIDISAPARDEELEERQRLRDAAAQSLGLGPLLENEQQQAEALPEEQEQAHLTVEELPPLPRFPSSPEALAPYIVLDGTWPKFYPPSSLRIFALSKQWKVRYILLSVPSGSVSHLHLFKGNSHDEREYERLEINADSQVHVLNQADAVPPMTGSSPSLDLSHVVKVAGADAGVRRSSSLNTMEDGRTVWLVHFPTSADAQHWISAIKTTILDQRSRRAGLPPLLAHINSASEPRGDMDVMLSMRIAANSNHTPKHSFGHPPPTPTSPTGTYAASLAPSASSVRSVATAPAGQHSQQSSSHSQARSQVPSSPKTGVSALKGLFTPGSRSRPRSSSAASVSSMGSGTSSRYAHTEEGSFARMGSLLAGSHTTNAGILGRKIVESESERDTVERASVELRSGSPLVPSEPLRRTTMSFSENGLQPAPRTHILRRWTGVEPESLRVDENPSIYVHPHASGSSGTAGSFGVRTETPSLREEDGVSDGHRSRASSVSGNGSTPTSRRRSSLLPRRLTPPSVPPPPVPASRSHPYASASPRESSGERAPSRASGRSFGSVSGPPTGSTGGGSFKAWRGKRASVISVGSLGSTRSTGSSVNVTATRHGMRTSMPPPPRPAPTGALPPAPDGGGRAVIRSTSLSHGSTQASTDFRESMAVTHRALRLSLAAPKPPPSGTLPEPPKHRRTHSNSGAGNGIARASSFFKTSNHSTGSSLHAIPASPAGPPPRGPLPPTPGGRANPSKLKQRLRILSAPPAPQPEPVIVSPRPTSMDAPRQNWARHMALASLLSASVPSTPTTPEPQAISSHVPATPPVPGTPIGEKIIQWHTQNDPSFLQISRASTPVLRPLTPLQAADEMVPYEVPSLLPPPRRGSRQISVKDVDRPPTPPPDTEGSKLFSLSRHGSVISLGIVTMS
ncbi:unnamed protein product [Mycena citricolor]|uniref:PH domain-containing protein n=1 Tax=Mycena citricolor TaxID=2018698 RepID=A0AAD2HY08_9AGAR|nr:unnamed protein product [Mycena citricolor]